VRPRRCEELHLQTPFQNRPDGSGNNVIVIQTEGYVDRNKGFVKIRGCCVGRTLLSDAFEFDFDFRLGSPMWKDPNELTKSKSKASDRSVGPTQTGYFCFRRFTVALSDPLASRAEISSPGFTAPASFSSAPE